MVKYKEGDIVVITKPGKGEKKFQNRTGKLVRLVADQGLWEVEFPDTREIQNFSEDQFELVKVWLVKTGYPLGEWLLKVGDRCIPLGLSGEALQDLKVEIPLDLNTAKVIIQRLLISGNLSEKERQILKNWG